MKNILLLGNPNSGKTTLFNALTGSNQKVGNWPGVTVEKKTGFFSLGSENFSVTDLPGLYSLTGLESNSPDECITLKNLHQLPCSLIINVIDATQLERQLYLTTQALELGKPMIVVLNMMDLAAARGIEIDLRALARLLNCPVVGLQANKKTGFKALYTAIKEASVPSSPLDLEFSSELASELNILESKLRRQEELEPRLASYVALRLLEGDKFLSQNQEESYSREHEFDLLLADARYRKIHDLVKKVRIKQDAACEQVTAKIDKIVLHRFFAIPIFLALMYTMFFFAINLGGLFQDFFDLASKALFVDETAALLQKIQAPGWLIALVSQGLGLGLNTTITFIPVIASMFFFLSLLEASGYMTRAAFVMDKLMRFLGLPGKAFIPMIVGFSCNVPAIMAARTLDSQRDRLLTILMSPFMSCSARLAIYAVFVAAFFPQGGQNIVFALYLIGIIVAVLTGYILKKTVLSGQNSPLLLELPAYHKPSLSRLWRETRFRLKYFIRRAGAMIIPVCLILGALNAISLDGSMTPGDAHADSILSMVGKFLTPLFSPLGLTQENWQATVGLLTGMLAKEVVVGSLNTLYTQAEPLKQVADFNLWLALSQALATIPAHLNELGSFWPQANLSSSNYGFIQEHFDGKTGAFAYLLFILLYVPCVSTLATIRQESKAFWMWLSLSWSSLLAYSFAVIFYQMANFWLHPQASLSWLFLLSFLLALFVFGLARLGRQSGGLYVNAAS